VIEVRLTAAFAEWLAALRDRRAAARVAERLRRIALGNAGDVKALGEGLSELRIDYGPGYRVYFTQRGKVLIIVLRGGDKTSQERDIARAKFLAKEI
jgi:putative addiction module killer protein